MAEAFIQTGTIARTKGGLQYVAPHPAQAIAKRREDDFVLSAILNGVICKRVPPEKYEGSCFVVPEKYRKRGNLNRWVEAVSVGPHCREDINPGDMLLIGDNAGTSFELEGIDYVLIWDTDPFLRERDCLSL